MANTPFIHMALHSLVQAIPRALAFAERFNGEAVLGDGRTLVVTSGFTGFLVFVQLLFPFLFVLYAWVRFHVKETWWDFSETPFGVSTVTFLMLTWHIYIYASCLAGTGCALSLGWVWKLMNPFWLKSEPNWLHHSFFSLPSLPMR